MARIHFMRELQRLQDDLIVLGSMVSHALLESVQALRKRDLEAAKKLIAFDREVNKRKYELEDACLTLIATQQPAASDLRLLAAILEISTELERMGDYAKGIGKITLYIGHEQQVNVPPQISQMCEKATDMLRRALDAFVNQDVDTARAIPLEDDELDDLYNDVNRQLIQMIVARPDCIDHANYMTWVAHNLERAGDRVTNICERVIYTATGDYVEFDGDEPHLSGLN
jgi:phosphate transport system protein